MPRSERGPRERAHRCRQGGLRSHTRHRRCSRWVPSGHCFHRACMCRTARHLHRCMADPGSLRNLQSGQLLREGEGRDILSGSLRNLKMRAHSAEGGAHVCLRVRWRTSSIARLQEHQGTAQQGGQGGLLTTKGFDQKQATGGPGRTSTDGVGVARGAVTREVTFARVSEWAAHLPRGRTRLGGDICTHPARRISSQSTRGGHTPGMAHGSCSSGTDKLGRERTHARGRVRTRAADTTEDAGGVRTRAADATEDAGGVAVDVEGQPAFVARGADCTARVTFVSRL